MNEKIDILMKQSYIEYGQDTRIFSPEKFAELIVAESYNALQPMLRDMISRGHAYDLIKQHFGV